MRVRLIFILYLAIIALNVSADISQHMHKQNAGCADNVITNVHCGKRPSSVISDAGVLWVVWVDHGHAYVSHSKDMGRTYSAPVVVNPQPELIEARGESRPKIALGTKGEIFITYTVKLAKKFTGNIRFSRSLNGGLSFSDPVTLNDNRDEIGHRFDSLVVTPENHVYVIWIDKRDRVEASKKNIKYIGASLYYTFSKDAGNSFGKNIRLTEHSCECCRIATTYDGVDVVSIWRHIFDTNTRDHRISRIHNPASMQRVSNDNWKLDGCPHHGPAISVDLQGRYHVSWYTRGQNRKGLYYARADKAGEPFTPPIQLGGLESQAGHSSLATVNNRVYVAWSEFDGRQSIIQFAEINASASGLMNKRVLASSQGDVDYPYLLEFDGQLFLAWQTRNEGYRLIGITQ